MHTPNYYWWSARFRIYHSTESRMLPIEIFKIKIKTQRTAKIIQRVNICCYPHANHTSTYSRTLAQSICWLSCDHITYTIQNTNNFISVSHCIISFRSDYTIFDGTHVCASECTVYYCKLKKENNNNNTLLAK